MSVSLLDSRSPRNLAIAPSLSPQVKPPKLVDPAQRFLGPMEEVVWPCPTLCKSLNLQSACQFYVTDMKRIFAGPTPLLLAAPTRDLDPQVPNIPEVLSIRKRYPGGKGSRISVRDPSFLSLRAEPAHCPPPKAAAADPGLFWSCRPAAAPPYAPGLPVSLHSCLTPPLDQQISNIFISPHPRPPRSQLSPRGSLPPHWVLTRFASSPTDCSLFLC
ncbi:uncharacterized protein LOC131380930 [Hylobates moloch]|uniref:uncharacterized protein LOC131380930 n=1 Tax=Hylobates moloch TaxID=81572 RepID=UPI00267526E3|nr:uncharacterized protein LOC131380930 [Hylobates moloch]